jgi:hypothetical protein
MKIFLTVFIIFGALCGIWFSAYINSLNFDSNKVRKTSKVIRTYLIPLLISAFLIFLLWMI